MSFATDFFSWLESRPWAQDVNAHQLVDPNTDPIYLVWEAESQPLRMNLSAPDGVQPKNVRLFVWGGPKANGDFVDDGQVDTVTEAIREDLKTFSPGAMGTGWAQLVLIDDDEADVDTPPSGSEDAAPYRALDLIVWWVPAPTP